VLSRFDVSAFGRSNLLMPIFVFEHSDHAGIERLGRTLNDYGHSLRILRLHDGDHVPADLDDCDGIIACGGPQSANDDSVPFLADEVARLRQAHEGGLPIVGICLGSQVLARALGGNVESMPGGIELGFTEVKLTPAGREDVLHAGLAWSSMMMQHHRDHVAQLPPGARLLASNAKCKSQAWALGLRSYGFQYHPEVSIDNIEAWIRDEPETLREAGLTAEQMLDQVARHYAAFERLTNRLFESIALFLMPVDRRYKGLVRDLHH
jgi:GMP synthase (glutamine-hydrolysing)